MIHMRSTFSGERKYGKMSNNNFKMSIQELNSGIIIRLLWALIFKGYNNITYILNTID